MIMIFFSMILITYQNGSPTGFLPLILINVVLKVAKNTFKDYDYVMQSHILQFISQEKDLGVIFNSRLSYDAHINDSQKSK